MQGESEDLIFPLLLLFFVQVTKEVNFSNGSKVKCFPNFLSDVRKKRETLNFPPELLISRVFGS